MGNFQIGIISDWLRLPFEESMKKCAALGAGGVQLYAVEGEMAPENLSPAARREKRAVIEGCGLKVSALCGDLGRPRASRGGRKIREKSNGPSGLWTLRWSWAAGW